MTDEKTRKPRTPKQTVVQYQDKDLAWTDVGFYQQNTEEALKWIDGNGESGTRYRVCTVQFEGTLVRTEIKKSVTSFQ
jgi:hypothetical protein